MRSSPGRWLPRLVRSGRSTRVEPTPAGGPAARAPAAASGARSRSLYLSSRSACRVRPPRCVRAPWPPPSARDARFLAAAVAALGRWPERKKRRKRGAPPGPCRSQRPGPATAPAPPPSPERTSPAWTGMGVRAAPSCAAAPAAAGAEQRRRPGFWPPSPPPLLLLLLLSLGLLHAGRRGPGGERAARALFWVPGTPRPWRGEHGVPWLGFTALPGAGSCPTASGPLQRPPLSGSQRAGAACGTSAPGLYCSPRGCLLEPAADRVSAALTACERRTEPCAAVGGGEAGNRTPCKDFFFFTRVWGGFRRNLSYPGFLSVLPKLLSAQSLAD